MARSKTTMLSTLIDASDEDDFADSNMDLMPTPDSQRENNAPAKRSRGAMAKPGTTASKVTKPKVVSRRASNGTATKPAAKTKGRKALVERTNVPNDGNDTEEVDDFEEVEEKAKPARKGKVAKPAKEKDHAPEASSAKTATRRKGTARTANVMSDHEIPESQPQPMEVEQTELEEDVDPAPLPRRKPNPPPLRQALLPQLSSRARSTSRQPDLYSRHKRGGSASDTERAGEPALRRKLGDVTRKLENLELKYSSLKELGSNDAQSNFDKLRKATDQRASDQDEIIAALKRELGSQKALTAESKTLRTQNATLEAEVQKLTSDNKSLSSSLLSSQQDIKSTQNEVKVLQAKITTMRSNSVDNASNAKHVPGSAIKSRAVGGVAAAKKEEELQEKMRIMRMKEDLYSDLTGLMIHNIKQLDNENVYDCMQTGRNGTLRFHLAVSHTDMAAATPGTTIMEEEFAYTPLLDEKNDQQLLEILPDYLTEDIVFPARSKSTFYLKIVDCMSKRYVEE